MIMTSRSGPSQVDILLHLHHYFTTK